MLSGSKLELSWYNESHKGNPDTMSIEYIGMAEPKNEDTFQFRIQFPNTLLRKVLIAPLPPTRYQK